MSKAILVLDEMPESCRVCKLGRMYGSYCCINGDTYVREGDRSEECPLKPLPKANDLNIDILSHDRFVDGWNKCLEIILGNEEYLKTG